MKNLIQNIIIILLCTEITLVLFLLLYIPNAHNIDVKNYTRTKLHINPVVQTLTKDDAKNIICDLFNTPHFYKESDLPNGIYGQSIIALRIITIDTDLNLTNYIITYAHELTHVKHQTMNETWVSFMTFVTLYKSGNEELIYHAKKYANTILLGGYEGTAYDCGYYILEYLGGANEK